MKVINSDLRTKTEVEVDDENDPAIDGNDPEWEVLDANKTADMLMASDLSNLIVDSIIKSLQRTGAYYCFVAVHLIYTKGLLNTALGRFVLKSCVTGYHNNEQDIYGLPGLEHHAPALYAILQTLRSVLMNHGQKWKL